MKTHTISVYSFDELSDTAKQKALDNHRYMEVEHYDWWDHLYNSFIERVALKGYTVSYKNIHFSGFWSQGDGACFRGRVHKTNEEILALLPCDLAAKIKLINSKLRLLGEDDRIDDLSCDFTLETSGRYSHSGTMRIDNVYPNHGPWSRCPGRCVCCPEWPQTQPGTGLCYELEKLHGLVEDALHSTDLQNTLLEEARGLADQLYEELEKEHEYLTSDEFIAERLRDSDTEFTEDGKAF